MMDDRGRWLSRFLIFDADDIRPLREIRRDLIRLGLKQYAQNNSAAARRLGISRGTARRRLRHVTPEDPDTASKT